MAKRKMQSSGLKLSLALLFLVVEGIFTFTPTYTWTDEETGEDFTCQQCPEGTFVAKHCTSTSKTDCQPCPEHHYTGYWNYVEKCRFCNVICEDKEQVKHECNATHNRVCECKPGFLWHSHYCKKDCRNKTDYENLECDHEVFEFVAHQHFTKENFLLLLHTVSQQEASKRIGRKQIRQLLRKIKNSQPRKALLPQLMKLVKETNMTHLERELQNRFIQ
ncbi:tumor necrosis factor receptor superfamily member 6B [Rana temporaria]|uniref:tumor necrosis factor receptor superfamily member 6B n=1 Tax=Rana temporaria TaxID=8407 RepID=UPI001AAD63BA|nr:tumor necrosis factor receptor superfamily member 6B [Rana temporaria]